MLHENNAAWLFGDAWRGKYSATKDSHIAFGVLYIIREGQIRKFAIIFVWASPGKRISKLTLNTSVSYELLLPIFA